MPHNLPHKLSHTVFPLIYPRGLKNTLHLRIRIPKRYRSVERRAFFEKSLGTDSHEIARSKAEEAKEVLFLRLEALLAGRDVDAAAWQEKLVEICEQRGFRYAPAADIAVGPLRNILERVAAIDEADASDAAALLGAGSSSGVPMSSLFGRYAQIKEVDLMEKSENQRHRWGLQPKRSITTFIEVVGDIDFLSMSRDDAARLRSHLAGRIAAGEIKPYSANRLIYTLATVCKTVASVQFGVDHEVLGGLLFKEKVTARRRRQIGFSTEWIREKLLGPAALRGMNDQATDILLVMVNTGLRPSEIVALTKVTIRLDANIPHVIIKAEGRELKSVSAERVVPLHGVSLEAMRRNPGGFPRYVDRATAWSNLVAKYLKRRKLLETNEHRAYSLRHAFSDRLADVACPDRIRNQLMGHREEGTAYGRGASLEALSGWVTRVAL